MAQQAVAAIEVAGINQQEARIVEQSEPDDQGRNPAGTVQAADVHPGNDSPAHGDVSFVNLDGRAEGQQEKQDCGEQKQGRRNEGNAQFSPEPGA